MRTKARPSGFSRKNQVEARSQEILERGCHHQLTVTLLTCGPQRRKLERQKRFSNSSVDDVNPDSVIVDISGRFDDDRRYRRHEGKLFDVGHFRVGVQCWQAHFDCAKAIPGHVSQVGSLGS